MGGAKSGSVALASSMFAAIAALRRPSPIRSTVTKHRRRRTPGRSVFAMPRRSRRATPRAAALAPGVAGRWTPTEAAEFAAQRDFRLYQLLATDQRAFAVARRLGVGSRASRDHQPHRGGAAAAPPQGGAPQQQGGAAPARPPNHKQRHSAARAAAHRAALAAAAAAAAAPAAAPALPAAVGASPAAPVVAPPKDASDADVDMGDDRPSSPSRASRVEHALLQAASDALARRVVARRSFFEGGDRPDEYWGSDSDY